MDKSTSGRSWLLGLLALLGLWLAVLLSGCVLPNIAPVAKAGADRTVTQGETVWLDGGESYDFNDDPLDYTWTITSKPMFSRGELVYTDSPSQMRLWPDLVGTYIVQLVVSDGALRSAADRVVIKVLEREEYSPPTPLPIKSPPGHAEYFSGCVKCHGQFALGKPSGHVRSSDQCELCHKNGAWVPASKVPVTPDPIPKYEHEGVIGGCFACHDGIKAAGKSITHISTSNACEICHLVGAWYKLDRVDMTQIFGSCIRCHNNTTATGKSASHIPSTDNCLGCHNVRAWGPSGIDHTQVVGACMSCHDGRMATGKSFKHVVTGEACDTCHNTTRWHNFPAAPAWSIPLVVGPRGSSQGGSRNARFDFAPNGQQIVDLRLFSNSASDINEQAPADLFYLKMPGAVAWEGFVRSLEQDAHAGPVELVQSGSGEVYAIWHNARNVFAQKYWPGKGWLGVTRISTTDKSFPVAALDVRRDNLGNVLVTWVRDMRRSRQLEVASLNADGTWQTLPELFVPSAANPKSLAITSLKNGSVAVVWNNFSRNTFGDATPDGLWGSVYSPINGWGRVTKLDSGQKELRPIISQAHIFAVGDGAKVVFASAYFGSAGSWPQVQPLLELDYANAEWGTVSPVTVKNMAIATMGPVSASANSAGKIVLAWPAFESKTREIAVSVANYSGSGWTSPDPVKFPVDQGQGGTALDVAINETGDALLALARHIPLQTLVADTNAYHKEVHVRRYSAIDGKWGSAAPVFLDEPIAPKTVGIPSVSVELDAAGGAYVTWTAQTGKAAGNVERLNVLTTKMEPVKGVTAR